MAAGLHRERHKGICRRKGRNLIPKSVGGKGAVGGKDVILILFCRENFIGKHTKGAASGKDVIPLMLIPLLEIL
jgi:hypothetical protein